MKLGYLLSNVAAVMAAVLFGAAVVATRVVVQDVPPLALAVLRFGQGGVVLFLVLFFGARHLLVVERRDLPYLVLLGVVFFAVFPMTFNIGIRYTEASRGALMIATMPIWSALLARAVSRERLTPRQVGGILMTFLGVGMVLAPRGLHWQSNLSALAGDGLLLLTAICGAVYGVLAKRMLVRYSPLTVTTYAMIFGTLLLLPAALAEGMSRPFVQPDREVVALVVFLGVVCGALGFCLWTSALAHLSPTQVAVYANVNPMVAIILGVVFLAEKISGGFIVGLVGIVAGVLLVNWPKKKSLGSRWS